MTISERRTDLAWVGRQLGALLGKISVTIDEWAKDLENDHEAERGTAASAGSPLSNHSLDSPSNKTLNEDVKPPRHVAQGVDNGPMTPHTLVIGPAAEAARHEGGGYVRMLRRKSDPTECDANRPRKKRRDCDFRVANAPSAAPPKPFAEPKVLKSGKRVRVNWSEAENSILCETVERFCFLGEEELVLEIVKALNGARTRFQAKGRFRNLLASGKIRSGDTVPQQWIVMRNPVKGASVDVKDEDVLLRRSDDVKAKDGSHKTEAQGDENESPTVTVTGQVSS